MPRPTLVEELSQDVRICGRSLLRSPVLTLTIVLTVGLGIGATTAIFSAVNAALLRPLPYAEPDRLVRIYTDTPPFVFRFSIVDYLALREQQTRLSQTATYTDRAATYSDGTVSELLRARVVSSGFFSLLGIKPLAGRDFAESDERPGSPAVAIASHAFWQQRLGGRDDAIGATVRLDGAPCTIVGVLPPRRGPLEQGWDLFLAQQFVPPKRRGPFFYTVLARLRQDADAAAAESELRAINRRIFPIWKTSYQDDKATWSLMPLDRHLVGDRTRVAGLALTAVALVWLIACANASSLLVARIISRRRELAVRAALGASRGRVVRYLLVESLLLALGSLLVGVAVARLGLQLLRGVASTYFPRMHEVELGISELWVMGALAFMSALLFGLVPAVHGAGGPVDDSLRASGRGATSSVGVRRLRRLLVAAQFAVATPLLVVAGLLIASLQALQQVDLGFEPRDVVTGSIRLPSALYAEPDRVRTFWDELGRRIGVLPGVAGVAFSDGRPPDGVGNINNFDLEDQPTPTGQSQPATPWVGVSPQYFGVLGLTLLEGRLLEERDALTENLESVVVDRAWARRFFPGGSAVGKRFREGGCTTCPWTTVVGVVTEVKYVGLDTPDDGTVYWPLDQTLARFMIVRSDVDAASIVASIRQAVRELEPAAPLSNVATVEELVAASLEQPQALSMLVTAFAGIALVLSVLGIYGVMAYYVQQHLKEISIRMALGGQSSDVLRLVIGHGMAVVAIGVGIGLAAAFGLTRLLESLLFGVGTRDAVTFVVVSVVLLATALAACLVPASRAVRVQPASILRND
jgi:putative ABC transport system permease protein